MEKIRETLENSIGKMMIVSFSRNDFVSGRLKSVFPDHIVLQVGNDNVDNYVMLAHVAYFTVH